jgi:hypothetical protein
VVEVTTGDANANARWNGTRASPANLAGAVQIKGSAAMTPGSSTGNTQISLDLSNASPGGVHPWQLRLGQCGADEGVFGSPEAYWALKVDDEGHATGAPAANPSTSVACGNMAPPSR